ncbi:MAG: triphosphoribosyl-dephospho-CoA synthase CitG [Oscillospiraceae bacterium]|nr:triphosphoribosyl-dephospho-CoA synthase CitG [Oscillospiraceae bacterium]
MEVTLQQILDAREDRVKRQRELLAEYHKPIVSFTMNIPGPVKLDRDVAIGFFVGCRLLRDALAGKLLYVEEHRRETGCEVFFVADLPAKELKELTVDLEDGDSVGRLFDMDVLDSDGLAISREALGYPRRKCLLCDEDAAVCARSRAHSVQELRDRTDFLLYLAARQHMAEYIAVRAYLALLQEVKTTPKPGLVDRRNSGAHKDMDMRHFFASANALRPFFCRFAEQGYLTRDLGPTETFQNIRKIGIEAEEAMLAATHGVNTHKGAIFTMGLLCAACGRLGPDKWQVENILAEIAAMTAGVVENDFKGVTAESAKTAGERLYISRGITGIRGQAEKGLPAVKNVGLPILKEGLKKGLSFNDAGAVALLHLMTVTEDTNIINRTDMATFQSVQLEIKALLQKEPFPDMATIETLDDDFIRRNLSPGGTADLLAATYFLFMLK